MADHDDARGPGDERMDQRLLLAGERWRQALPPTAVPPFSAGRAGRRLLAPVAAAAAAVAAITTATLLVGNVIGSDPAPVTSDPTSSPTDGSPAGPAACGPGDLVLGEPQTEGAAGTMVTYADLTLAPGAAPCTMRGYPSVSFLDHGSDLGLAVGHNQAFRPRTVRMTADATATVTVGWAVHHYCGDLDNDALRLTLPGGQVVELPGFGTTSCSPGEQQPAPWVGAVTLK